MELTIEQTLQRGVAAHKEGQLKDAERLYRAILQSEPAHPDANHNLGVLAVSVNQLEVALPLLKTALKVSPMIKQFWVSYIDALVKAKKLKEAKQAIKKAKKVGLDVARLEKLLTQSKGVFETKEPLQAQLDFLLECYQNERYTKAEKLALSTIREFPKNQFAWKALGAIYQQTDRKVEAVNANQRAVSLSPKDSEAHCNLGLTLQELGKLCEAEASYIEAIKLQPDFAEAHYNFGITLEELGRLEEAEASYTQAIALKPCYVEALINRSHLLFDTGRFEAALTDADACSSRKAKVLSLMSLYALGRIDEIYRRIEFESKDDVDDMGIAAFAAFISEAHGKPTAYKFCPNPIRFISVSNLSLHVNDSGAYVEHIIDELNKIETTWEPVTKSTIGGFQSLATINLFENSSRNIAQLKSIILNELAAYLLKFENEPCSYIEKFPSDGNLSGWTVILKKHGNQSTHIHPDGWLSGVIYLKVVPCQGKNEGAIEFSLNGKNYYDKNSSSYRFQPQAGDIIFFPSSLHHRTIPFTTDEERITISFDLTQDVGKH